MSTHPIDAAPAKDSVMKASLKDAGIAALITLGLALFMIGLKTNPGTGGLTIESRWLAVVIAVAIVFGGRLLLNLLFWKTDRQLFGGKSTKKASATKPIPWLGRVFSFVLLIVALTLPLLMPIISPDKNRYVIDLSILILTYVMLGWGLNIVVGLAGLLDPGGWCWAFRCCACAATTWPSSRWRSAKSSASSCSTGIR